jgi:transposase
MYERARESSLLHMDETVLQVLKENERFAQQQSHMWVITNNEANARITLFHYSPTRKTSEADWMLGDFSIKDWQPANHHSAHYLQRLNRLRQI